MPQVFHSETFHGGAIRAHRSCTDCHNSLTHEEICNGTVCDGISHHTRFEYYCADCLPKHLCVICRDVTPSAEKDCRGRVAHQDTCQMECAQCGQFHAAKQLTGSEDWFCGGCIQGS